MRAHPGRNRPPTTSVVPAPGGIRHVTEEVLATYTLQLIGPAPLFMQNLGLVGIKQSYLREAEENLTDLLPEGYSVRIRGWDEEEK